MSRVIVVGAGLGGCFAALSAKTTNPDADVHLLAVEPDRYRYEPGTVDVLGSVPGDEEPVVRPTERIGALPAEHPYKLVGEEGVNSALDYLDDVLRYRGTDRNALAPTVTGGIRPTYRYPAAVAAGLVSSQRPMHIVGLESVTHLDAELAAERLDSALPFDVNASTIEFPVDSPETPPLEAFAQTLDENSDTADGTPVREALAQRVRPALDIEARVGFPPVLGLAAHDEIRTELESRLQADVFEIPVGEPNLLGIRLREQLFDAVEAAGIELTRASVTDFSADEESIRSVSVDGADSQRTIEGDAFVLATGGVAAGGLVGTGTEVIEPIFDCPVDYPDTHKEWAAEGPLDDHAFARFGVDVTPSLKPSVDGDPVFENLFSAGSVLGGYNFVEEGARTGVAVVTGYEAGRRAVDR